MKVFRGRAESVPSELREATFTGTVWSDPVMPAMDGVMVGNVFFSPKGRTHWHAHERGQVLHVSAGKGWICKDGEVPEEIRAGDVVWIAPGERHWHGAAMGSFMIHMAYTLGRTDWQDPVTDAQYPEGD